MQDNTGHPPIAYSYVTAGRAVGGMSEDFIQKEVKAGRLGFVKLGSRVTIPHDELVRWYESQVSGPIRSPRPN
ncbi:hypothetical protein AOT96_13240 [Rhodococcus sp. 008]|nr:hypothetical protein AOT96_13240 [Rhodococcus sp. 008]